MSSSHYISSLLTSQLYKVFSNNGYFFCKKHGEQRYIKLREIWEKKTTKLCYCPLSTKLYFVTFRFSLTFNVIKIYIN